MEPRIIALRDIWVCQQGGARFPLNRFPLEFWEDLGRFDRWIKDREKEADREYQRIIFNLIKRRL